MILSVTYHYLVLVCKAAINVFVKSTATQLLNLKSVEKRHFCLNALQKYIGLGHKNESTKEHLQKSTFKL